MSQDCCLLSFQTPPTLTHGGTDHQFFTMTQMKWLERGKILIDKNILPAGGTEVIGCNFRVVSG